MQYFTLIYDFYCWNRYTITQILRKYEMITFWSPLQDNEATRFLDISAKFPIKNIIETYEENKKAFSNLSKVCIERGLKICFSFEKETKSTNEKMIRGMVEVSANSEYLQSASEYFRVRFEIVNQKNESYSLHSRNNCLGFQDGTTSWKISTMFWTLDLFSNSIYGILNENRSIVLRLHLDRQYSLPQLTSAVTVSSEDVIEKIWLDLFSNVDMNVSVENDGVSHSFDASKKSILVDLLKEKGNQLFKSNNLEGARKLYSRALTVFDGLGNSKKELWSNRSVTSLKLGLFDDALEEAKMCVNVAPMWCKGVYRLASAYFSCQKFLEACQFSKYALELYEADHQASGASKMDVQYRQLFLKARQHTIFEDETESIVISDLSDSVHSIDEDKTIDLFASDSSLESEITVDQTISERDTLNESTHDVKDSGSNDQLVQQDVILLKKRSRRRTSHQKTVARNGRITATIKNEIFANSNYDEPSVIDCVIEKLQGTKCCSAKIIASETRQIMSEMKMIEESMDDVPYFDDVSTITDAMHTNSQLYHHPNAQMIGEGSYYVATSGGSYPHPYHLQMPSHPYPHPHHGYHQQVYVPVTYPMGAAQAIPIPWNPPLFHPQQMFHSSHIYPVNPRTYMQQPGFYHPFVYNGMNCPQPVQYLIPTPCMHIESSGQTAVN